MNASARARGRELARRSAHRLLAPAVQSDGLRRRWLRRHDAQHRGLVLLWHRVRPEGPQPWSLVPTVTPSCLRRQIADLQSIGEVVPLSAVADADAPGPRFALTFDDDDAGHAEQALPVLREMGVTATFFLSGRWLHGLGPYWWEVLEERIRREGLAAVAASYAVTASSAEELAWQLEGTGAAEQLAAEGRDAGRPPMLERHVEALVDAGMSIGFHTVHHRVLPLVAPERVEAELDEGRRDLEQWLGQPLSQFAYPHGKASRAVADALQALDFRAAWTSSQRPVDGSEDPFLRGRWEPRDRVSAGLQVGTMRRLAVPPE